MKNLHLLPRISFIHFSNDSKLKEILFFKGIPNDNFYENRSAS